ncbi:hypothetical protein HIM_00138 [Hirsutella minnesotensis 3608]|nr:hypothetical protein HIM_00138 [Hirsutella minnesotensis 3608]
MDMVGVPGRSNACHNCKHRRIRCGGELPACRNCAKSRRVCTGYHRQHAFIMSQDMVPETGSSCRALAARQGESGPVMLSRWRACQSRSSTPSPLLATTMVLPQVISNRNTFGSRLLSLMADVDLSGSLYHIFGDRYDWHAQLLHLPVLSPALEHSLLALCMARLGRHADRPALVRKSLELYVKGVAIVRRNLVRPPMQIDAHEQTLAACLSLLLYETVECPNGTMNGYQAHYRGCLELLQSRGAQCHASGLGHASLQILRLHTVHAVLGDPSRASFLTHPDWLDIPWSGRSSSKSLFDRLIDILLAVSDYFARTESTPGVCSIDKPCALQNAYQVREQGQRLRSALQHWYEGFREAVPGPLYHAELSKVKTVVDDAASGQLFPVAYRFPSFVIGQAIVYYWIGTTMIQARRYQTDTHLACLRRTLESRSSGEHSCPHGTIAEAPTDFSHDPVEDLLPVPGDAQREGWAAAYHICQSAEYFLHDVTRGFGPASVLPALTWVKGLWKQRLDSCSRDREIAWIDAILVLIHSRGYGIAGAIRSSV